MLSHVGNASIIRSGYRTYMCASLKSLNRVDKASNEGWRDGDDSAPDRGRQFGIDDYRHR